MPAGASASHFSDAIQSAAAATRIKSTGFVGFLLVTATAAAEAPCPFPDSMQVRSIAFAGLKTTREQVVRRELSHAPGARFSCAEWIAERTRLEDLDIFADIRLRAQSTGSAVDTGADSGALVYAFRELPPYIPFVSVLLTDQDGLSLGPALASLNFLGRDIRAEFMARFGGTTEFLASVSSPWLGDWPVEYDLALIRVDSYNPFEDFHEDSWRLKLDLEQRLPGRFRFLYAGEIFSMRADRLGPEALSPVTLSPGADFIPRLAVGGIWDGRDRRHLPRKGVYQEVRLTHNGGWIGGDADYVEWLIDTRAYLPWSERNVLYLGALYQYRTGKLGRDFPVYDRFHAGGINTLRGHAHDAFQGKSEWIATVENRVDVVRKRIFRLWKWSAFLGLQGLAGVEAASLWGHRAPLERDFESGAFLGLHIITAGVDRIRLEAGSNTAKVQLRFGLGILEKADVQRFRTR